MKLRLVKLVTIATVVACALYVALSSYKTSSVSASESEYVSTGYGTVENLEANYKEWEAQYEKEGGDRNWTLAMGWFKGLSTEQTYAKGRATVNLIDGTVSVAIDGLPKEEGWDVWLIDSDAGSILPEASDNILRIGSLQHEGKVAKLKADLGDCAFADFELDLIMVTRAGMSPIENRVLVGTTTLFHRLYRSKQRGEFGALSDHPKQEAPAGKRGLFARLLNLIIPTAEAQIGPQEGVNNLITRGRRSFFNETFNGNGRTCGTCHREDENLTISAEFISTLPISDPLFAAETQLPLMQNFENPVLMRKLGLILENVDGFQDLANKFVMRGVPHTLALLQNTLTPVPGGGDGTTIPPNERTGWSGDGAPGTGTLREFITGAITQHYPKTLARIPASGGLAGDFRLATPAEMDELEAFMKSTGRRADLVLTGPGALSLKNEVAALGQLIFNNPSPGLGLPNSPKIAAGNCFLCHVNAGASDFFFPGANANFNTNIEGLPAQPADLVQPPQPNPQDGGFGATGTSPTGGFGNGSFNTPVLVEAADTGPFFHNNAIDTIEGAVDFYNSDAFNKAPGFGGVLTGNQGLIKLAATEVVAVAAFLRAINALENIRSARDLAVRARNSTNQAIVNELLVLAIADAADGHKVLNCGNLHFKAQRDLLDAIAKLNAATQISNKPQRDAVITQAIASLDAARIDIRN
ncbi:MAG TPA: hypothetical protein VJ810_12250 [Blastocatellia bacterium]|nr:hypothetical protein [Blastocatellia bacterium]